MIVWGVAWLGGGCLVVRCVADGFPLAACVAAAQGGDGASAGDGPSPAGQFQALADRLAACLDGTGADEQAAGPEPLAAHAGGVVLEIAQGLIQVDLFAARERISPGGGADAASPAAGIVRPRADPGSSPPSALTRDQALALVHAADAAPGPQRARTAALVAVLLFAGARVSEVIGADVGDLGTERGRLVLRVTRTNGRRQSLALPGPAASRIDAYLAGRPGLTSVPVLFATRTGGRLFAADVGQAVRRLATRAELPADLASHLGPRMMRHSFAALYLEAGGSLRDLQSALGYAEPRTTRRYDQARHTAVIHLARPQQRHRAPPQPAYQARDPSPGSWPGSRPHCRARRPQHAREPTRNRQGKAEGNPS